MHSLFAPRRKSRLPQPSTTFHSLPILRPKSDPLCSPSAATLPRFGSPPRAAVPRRLRSPRPLCAGALLGPPVPLTLQVTPRSRRRECHASSIPPATLHAPHCHSDAPCSTRASLPHCYYARSHLVGARAPKPELFIGEKPRGAARTCACSTTPTTLDGARHEFGIV